MSETECDLETAIENTQPLIKAGRKLADQAVKATALEAGRTVEKQWERMGDKFAYEAVEQDPNQMQLDDLTERDTDE